MAFIMISPTGRWYGARGGHRESGACDPIPRSSESDVWFDRFPFTIAQAAEHSVGSWAAVDTGGDTTTVVCWRELGGKGRQRAHGRAKGEDSLEICS